MDEKVCFRATLVFALLTMGLGLLLRWDLAGGIATAHGFLWANLRHAHSHAGYYGVLTLAWWLVEREAGLVISRRLFVAHVLASLAAIFGFAFAGYGVLTIVLSTWVAAHWLWVAFKRRARGRAWLDVASFGMCVAVLLIPAIAFTGKRDVVLSRDLAHVFMSTLMLTVFVPAAWQAGGLERTISAPVFTCFAVAASLHFVFREQASVLVGLLAGCFSLSVLWMLVTQPLPIAARLCWITFAFVPWMSAAFSWRIAGFHWLVLGPVLLSILGKTRVGRVPVVVRRVYVAALLAMMASIVAPGSSAFVTAVASSLFAASAFVSVFFMWGAKSWTPRFIESSRSSLPRSSFPPPSSAV